MAKKINYDNWSKEELVTELRRIKETKYGLVWHRDLPEEKIDVLINPDASTPNEMFPNEMAGKPFPVLKEAKNKGIETDKTGPMHLLIEGDNYHSLAVLNFSHQEAVDLIYIDPPYNTGNNDFVYNDNIKSDYIKRDDPFRHSKWISFMERRLKLAKLLLKKQGVIFISIDDNEQAALKMLCDEIFGESNFIANLMWKSKSGGANDSRFFAIDHEYILVYAKDANFFKLNLDLEAVVTTSYNLEDKDGPYALDRLDKQSIRYSLSLDYEITGPDGTKYYPKHKDPKRPNATWRWGRKTVKERYDELVFKNGCIYTKNYQKEGAIPRSLLLDERFGRTRTGKTELFELFGREVFQNPKPTKLIRHIIGLIQKKDAVILDFMAGSGTTGDAVLQKNKEDGGQRQFILCTNNENNICTDICYPRLKKVIEGYKNPKKQKVAGLGGNLKYYSCDFVEAEPTDRNKRKLVSESTELLCIKENTFDLVQDGGDFKIFRNGDKHLGIVFYEEAIGDFKNAIKKLKGHFNVYVFSLGDDTHEKAFTDVRNRVTLCAIPEVILKVYREIFK